MQLATKPSMSLGAKHPRHHIPHRGALKNYSAGLAKLNRIVTVAEIEEYVNNLWYMDEDLGHYAGD